MEDHRMAPCHTFTQLDVWGLVLVLENVLRHRVGPERFLQNGPHPACQHPPNRNKALGYGLWTLFSIKLSKGAEALPKSIQK